MYLLLNNLITHFIFQQDHLTKHVQLRPLITKTALEVTSALISVLCTIGPPCILHTDNGKEFKNLHLIERVHALWPQVKMVYGSPRHSQSQGVVENCNEKIQSILYSKLRDLNCSHWVPLLPIVQYIKNTRFCTSTEASPLEAVLGHTPTFGINSISLPPHKVKNLKTEEQLEHLLSEMNYNYQHTYDVTYDRPVDETSRKEIVNKTASNSHDTVPLQNNTVRGQVIEAITDNNCESTHDTSHESQIPKRDLTVMSAANRKRKMMFHKKDNKSAQNQLFIESNQVNDLVGIVKKRKLMKRPVTMESTRKNNVTNEEKRMDQTLEMATFFPSEHEVGKCLKCYHDTAFYCQGGCDRFVHHNDNCASVRYNNGLKQFFCYMCSAQAQVLLF